MDRISSWSYSLMHLMPQEITMLVKHAKTSFVAAAAGAALLAAGITHAETKTLYIGMNGGNMERTYTQFVFPPDAAGLFEIVERELAKSRAVGQGNGFHQRSFQHASHESIAGAPGMHSYIHPLHHPTPFKLCQSHLGRIKRRKC